MTTALYAPTDILGAYESWRANCGPAAVAAILGFEVNDLRECFPLYPEKAWANPTLIRTVLTLHKVRHRNTDRSRRGGWPMWGLAFLQFEGPWLADGVSPAVAYRHTHWVAVSDRTVFDVNAGQWIPGAEWRADIMPLLQDATPKATGWHLRLGIEVTRSGEATAWG